MYTLFLVTDGEEHRRQFTRAAANISGYRFLGDAYTREKALEEIPSCDPDIVFVDLAIGGGTGVSLIRELSNRVSLLALVAFAESSRREAEKARHALSAGATGFLRTADIYRDLERALRHASRGEIFLSEAVREQIESAARDVRDV